MHTLMSFHASAVRRDQVGAIIADYLALERARHYRRVLVAGFGLLAALILGVGAAVHHGSASWLAAGLCLPLRLGLDHRAQVRLAPRKRLDEVPKVIKSS